VAALLMSLLLASCESSGDLLWTVWGPLSETEGSSSEVTYSWGGSFGVNGLAHRQEVLSPDSTSRDFLELVLVSGSSPVTCSIYTDYLAELQEIQQYIDAVRDDAALSPPASAEWFEYVCQEINGAALRAFGGDGSYRAVHALLLVDSAPPPPAVFPPRKTVSPVTGDLTERFFGAETFAESLLGNEPQQPEWTYVSRTYERSKHGAGVLPISGDEGWTDEDTDPAEACTQQLAKFIQEETEPFHTYPDTASMALQAATHRYYHQYTSQQTMPLGANRGLVSHGLVLPRWQDAATSGEDLGMTLIGRASRGPASMPYERMVLTTQDDSLPALPCEQLSPYLPVVWPELFEDR